MKDNDTILEALRSAGITEDDAITILRFLTLTDRQKQLIRDTVRIFSGG